MRTYVAPGGCIEILDERLTTRDVGDLAALEDALRIQPRAELVDAVADRTGLTLCGAGAPPCTGD